MNEWEQARADEKRDKQLPLRASTNDFNLLDGLLADLKSKRLVPTYSKYSRMDLIIDALKAYRATMLPEEPGEFIVLKLDQSDRELLNDLQAKRKMLTTRRTSLESIIVDTIRHASGQIVFEP